jgi:Flp pilus assembly protein TadD
LQNKRDEAIRNYNKAVEINPASTGSVIALADLYLASGNESEAVRLLQDARKRSPQDGRVALSAALALEKVQRWQEARTVYEQVLQLDQDNAIALNNLAWLLAEHEGNIDVALKLAQQAKQRQASNVQITNTIGWIYYKKNSYEMALQYLKESASKKQDNPLYQYHLGMVYSKLGRVQEARQALQAALRLDPNFSQARQAQRALADL